MTSHFALRRSVVAGMLLAALLGPALAPVTHAAPRARGAHATPVWARYNATTRTARLRVIASYGSDGYNFNGGSNGAFKFTVPVKSRVIITFSNDSPMMPHGLEIVKWTGALPTDLVPPDPAFPNAFSPNYRHGTPNGVTQKIAFVASKVGKYLMICPVHNHVKFGHWAWFIVSKKAKTATGVLTTS